MTNIQQTQSRPAGDTRQPDSSGKWYIDPVTHKLIVPDIDKCRPKLPNLTEIKARMTAKLKPDMFPELRDQVKKLVGDAVSVRDTIQEAFHKDFLKGFDALASACLAVADVEMCQCLVVVLGKLGRYDCFELLVQIELEFISRRAPAEEVRQTAAKALAALQRGKHRLASDLSPGFLPRVTRRACSLIASATTGKAARNGEPSDSSPPPPAKSPPSGRRQKKARAAAKQRREPSPDQLMELINSTLASGSTYCGALNGAAQGRLVELRDRHTAAAHRHGGGRGYGARVSCFE